MIHVIHHPNGPRVYILRCRLHHGTTGVLLLLTSILRGRKSRLRASAPFTLVGLLLALHDRSDAPYWFRLEFYRDTFTA